MERFKAALEAVVDKSVDELISEATPTDGDEVSYFLDGIEAENEITQDLSDLTEIGMKVSSLECIALALESLEAKTPKDIAVAKLAFGLAAYGTDIDAAILDTVSLEDSIKDTLSNLYHKALQLFKDIWRKITDFMSRVFSFIPKRIRELEALLVAVRNAPDDAEETEMKAKPSIVNNLYSDSSKFDYDTIKSAITVLQKESSFYLGEYITTLVAMRREINDTLLSSNNISTLGKGGTVSKLVKAGSPHYAMMQKKYPFLEAGSQGNVDKATSDVLPGGYKVVVSMLNHKTDAAFQHSLDSDDEKTYTLMKNVYHTRVNVVNDVERSKDLETMSVLTQHQMTELLKDCIAQLKYVLSHKNTYDRFRGETQRAWDNMFSSNAAKALNATDAFERKNQYAMFKLRFATTKAYAEWSKEPINGLISVSMRTSTGISNYVKESLLRYQGAVVPKSEQLGLPQLT